MTERTSGYPIYQGPEWLKGRLAALRRQIGEVRALAQKGATAGARANTRLDGVDAGMGLTLIRPSAAQLVNATLQADGRITLNATDDNWAQIRNVFTSERRGYRILFNVQGATANSLIYRLMVGSTMLDGAGMYVNSYSYITASGAFAGAFANSTYGRLSAVFGSGRVVGAMDLLNPANSDDPTTSVSNSLSANLSNTCSVVYSDNSAHDGIAFQRGPAAPPKTTVGWVKLYAYA